MIGETIRNKYRVLDQISEDHLVTNFLTRDQALNEMVVLKLIRPEIKAGSQFLERFSAEAEKLQNLTTRQALKALDWGELETGPYTIFEYTGGKTLADVCQAEGALSLERALDIAAQLGLCLVDAHEHNLMHGDLRPDHVTLNGDGQIKVTNFGLAWSLDLGRLIADGAIERNEYHAPELSTGATIDGRTDLYSLGAILFEILTGRRSALMAPDHHPASLVPDLPADIDDLVARCLAQEPDARPQSAAEFLEGIDEVLHVMSTALGSTILGREEALAGHTLGAYRLVEKLGRGGMAAVYKAYEPSLDRYVAIKILPQHFAHDPTFITRFRREAKAIARLSHPNIVPVFNFGKEGDLTYIVMRYVEGGTLKDMLGRPMATGRAVKLVIQIAQALSYAHKRDVVHRDIKPANVLLAEGDWPLLSDFGLARMMGSSVQITQTGVGVGTPAYMSPEQGQGLKVDGRSDIYSLGILLYEMLTGHVPFQADTPLAVVLKHITSPLPMPREVNPDIPESVERIVLKATAKDPDHRFQTADEMIEALEGISAGLPVEAPPAPVSETIIPTAPPSAVTQPPTPSPSEVSAATEVLARPEPKRRIPVWALGLVGVLVIVGLIAGAILSGLFSPETPIKSITPQKADARPVELVESSPPVAATATSIPIQATASPLSAVLFEDSFEGAPAPGWHLEPAEAWQAETIAGRSALMGAPDADDNAFAWIQGDTWTDYVLQLDINILSNQRGDYDGLHLNMRHTEAGSRYIVWIAPDALGLQKYVRGVLISESSDWVSPTMVSPDEWHTVQVTLLGGQVHVLMDGRTVLQVTDPDEPLRSGGFSLEVFPGSQVLFDNVRVTEIIPGAPHAILSTQTPLRPVFAGDSPMEASHVKACEWDGLGQGLCIYPLQGGRPARILEDAQFEFTGSPSWSPDGRRIAFSALRPGESEDDDNKIYVVQANGDGLTQLPSIGNDISPAWSPDGEWLAFHSNGLIATMHPDGSDPAWIWEGTPCSFQPQWSPDSQWIVISMSMEGCEWPFPWTREVWVISHDGRTVNTVATITHEEDDCVHTEVAFSPDATRVAYIDDKCRAWVTNADGSGRASPLDEFPFEWTSAIHPQWAGDIEPLPAKPMPPAPGLGKVVGECEGLKPPQICIYDAQTDQVRQLTDHLEFENMGVGTWSPDGQQIAFHAGSDPEVTGQHDHKLYLINADGSDLRQITSGDGNDIGPAWSPDMDWIAFHRNCDLWVVRPDGSRARRLLPGSEVFCAVSIAWSPDSRQIAFFKAVGDETSPQEIWVINRDGTAHQAVYSFEQPIEWAGVAWSPDGRRIAFGFDDRGVTTSLLINADGSGEAQPIDEVPESWLPSFWPPWGGEKTVPQAADAPPESRRQIVVPPDEPIRLAFVGDLSGDVAEIGEVQKNGFLLALEDLPTVKGFPIDVAIVANGGCTDEGVAKEVAEHVTSDLGIAGVIGHTCSASCAAGIDEYEAANLVMISPSCSAPDLSEHGYQIFNRVIFRDDQGGAERTEEAANTAPFDVFSRRYQGRYGQPLEDIDSGVLAAYAYDATVVLIRSIKQVAEVDETGNLIIDRQALARAVRATADYDGVTGTISFDDKGDRLLP